MKVIKAIPGFLVMVSLLVLCAKVSGCATLKNDAKEVAKDSVECIAPTAADATAIFSSCKAQGGEDKWCALLAARAGVEFAKCLWDKHVAGGCDSATCPFPHHTDAGADVSPDAGAGL